MTCAFRHHSAYVSRRVMLALVSTKKKPSHYYPNMMCGHVSVIIVSPIEFTDQEVEPSNVQILMDVPFACPYTSHRQSSKSIRKINNVWFQGL